MTDTYVDLGQQRRLPAHNAETSRGQRLALNGAACALMGGNEGGSGGRRHVPDVLAG